MTLAARWSHTCAQETPLGKANSSYVFFERTVYLQMPLERLPRNAAIFFEFRHFKVKKDKVRRRGGGRREGGRGGEGEGAAGWERHALCGEGRGGHVEG